MPNSNSFETVRVRYIVAAWLLMLFCLPGADVIFANALSNAPWYWWLVSYVLYGQLLFSLVVVLTVLLPRHFPLSGSRSRPR